MTTPCPICTLVSTAAAHAVLPGWQRRLLRWVERDGLGYREAARRLGLRPSVVQMLVFLARRRRLALADRAIVAGDAPVPPLAVAAAGGCLCRARAGARP